MTGLQLVIDLEGDTSWHLTKALTEHGKWCRVNGVTVPSGLEEATKRAQAVAQWFSHPLPPEVAQGERMRPALLTLPEAAKELGCSLTKVKKLVGESAIPTVDFDGVRRIRSADLDSYLDGLAAGGSFRDQVVHKERRSA